MKGEYYVSGGIILVALIAVGIYLYTRHHADQVKQEARRAHGPIEHAQCDPYRLEVARLKGEIKLIQNDPLRSGNAAGELARNNAFLTECERQANRDDV